MKQKACFFLTAVLLFCALPGPPSHAHEKLKSYAAHQKVRRDLTRAGLDILSPAKNSRIVEDRLFYLVNLNMDLYDPASVEIRLNGKTAPRPFYRLPYRVLSEANETVAVLRLAGFLDLSSAGHLGSNEFSVTAARRAGRRETVAADFVYRPFPIPVTFDVTVSVRGVQERPGAVKVILVGQGDTETPDFSPFDYDAFNRGRNFFFLPEGRGIVRLPRGTFKVYITRGMAYDAVVLTLDTNRTRQVQAVIKKHLTTPDALCGDFHVHCLISEDSIVPPEQRVLEYAAAGLDFIVATDHETFTNYDAILDLSPFTTARVPVLAGNETSVPDMGNWLGHWNVFPARMDRNTFWAIKPFPADLKMGSIPNMYEAFALGKFSSRFKKDITLPEDFVIQLNHPRGLHFVIGDPIFKKVHAYFNHQRIDIAGELDTYIRSRQKSGAGLHLFERSDSGRYRAIDFDALEVFNRKSIPLYKRVREDWFTLLNYGFRKTATANTDSHSLVMTAPGFPRNYLFLNRPVKALSGRLAAETVRAVKEGRVACTTGPLVRLSAKSGGHRGGLGRLVPVSDGAVVLSACVKAAPWVPVPEVRIIKNGKTVKRFSPAGSPASANRVTRFQRDIMLPVREDSWVILECGYPLETVGNSQPETGGLYGIIAPGHVPVAFTNPIYFDADGNGLFNPPKNPDGVQ
jgi:hypothetical protein